MITVEFLLEEFLSSKKMLIDVPEETAFNNIFRYAEFTDIEGEFWNQVSQQNSFGELVLARFREIEREMSQDKLSSSVRTPVPAKFG